MNQPLKGLNRVLIAHNPDIIAHFQRNVAGGGDFQPLASNARDDYVVLLPHPHLLQLFVGQRLLRYLDVHADDIGVHVHRLVGFFTEQEAHFLQFLTRANRHDNISLAQGQIRRGREDSVIALDPRDIRQRHAVGIDLRYPTAFYIGIRNSELARFQGWLFDLAG